MKNILIRSFTIILVVFILSIFLSSCKKENNTVGIVIVYYLNNNQAVDGAKVRFYNGDIDISVITDSNGKASHIFDNEAILNIEATKGTAKGSSSIRLKPGETVEQHVYIQ
jgi:hypothetical protein